MSDDVVFAMATEWRVRAGLGVEDTPEGHIEALLAVGRPMIETRVREKIENGVDLDVWEPVSPEGIDEVLMYQVEDIARVGTQWYFRKGAKQYTYEEYMEEKSNGA